MGIKSFPFSTPPLPPLQFGEQWGRQTEPTNSPQCRPSMNSKSSSWEKSKRQIQDWVTIGSPPVDRGHMPGKHLSRLMPCHYAGPAICPHAIMPHPASDFRRGTCLDSNLNCSALLSNRRGHGIREGQEGTILLFSLFAGQLVHLVLGPGLAKEGLGDGGGWHDIRPAPDVRVQHKRGKENVILK